MKVSKIQIDKCVSLLNNENWGAAEDALLHLRKSHDGRVLYLLGMLFIDLENPNKDKAKAKRFFELSVESEKPIEDAFVRLAQHEDNRLHSARILKKGLKYFPDSEELYNYLLRYSQASKREKIYIEAEEKGCLSERIKINMAETYFGFSKYKECLELLSTINADTNADRDILKCREGFCLYELGKNNKAELIFKKLVDDDINHQLIYAPMYGLILTLINKNQLSKAENIAMELPLDIDIETLVGVPWGEAYFDAEEYNLKAIKLLLKTTKLKDVKGRLRGLRGLYTYSEAFETEAKFKTSQLSVIRDFEFAHSVYPLEMRYVEYLFWIFSEDNRDSQKAWKMLLKYVLGSDEDISIEYFFESLSSQDFRNIVDDFIDKAKENPHKVERLIKVMLEPILSRYFDNNDYKNIVSISDLFNSKELSDSSSLFMTAFAYSKLGNKEKAKRYYLLELENNMNNAPTLNNLGVIYSGEGDLVNAIDCYKKASEIDNEDKLYKKNLKSAEKTLKEKDKKDFLLRSASNDYESESPYTQSKVIDFYKHRNSDGFIICSYRQAPQYLKMSGIKATEFLKDLLTKKYFVLVTDHGYDTQTSVYKLNPYLQSELAKIEASLRNEDELLDMCKRLNNDSFKLIGYDDDLLKNVSKMSSEDLKIMLQRDLRENAIAVILKQNKSALVLSGSIIEAIITDRIISNGIIQVKINNKSKRVLDMDLNQLLKIAVDNIIIDSTMAHLAHAVRGYRNLIHPGVEQRKKTIQVSGSNVDLAWGIVKKLLKEIV